MKRIKAKMNRLQNTVNVILLNDPATRDNDDVLYVKVIESINAGLLDLDVEDFFTHRFSYNVPSYNAVSRLRRKAQEEHPELASCIDVQLVREVLEDEYREWSKAKEI